MVADDLNLRLGHSVRALLPVLGLLVPPLILAHFLGQVLAPAVFGLLASHAPRAHAALAAAVIEPTEYRPIDSAMFVEGALNAWAARRIVPVALAALILGRAALALYEEASGWVLAEMYLRGKRLINCAVHSEPAVARAESVVAGGGRR